MTESTAGRGRDAGAELRARILDMTTARPGGELPPPEEVAQRLGVPLPRVYRALATLVARRDLEHRERGPYWKAGESSPASRLVAWMGTLRPGQPILPTEVGTLDIHPAVLQQELAYLGDEGLIHEDADTDLAVTTLGVLAHRPWAARGRDRGWRVHRAGDQGRWPAGRVFVVATTRVREVVVFPLLAGSPLDGVRVSDERRAVEAVVRGDYRDLQRAVSLALRPGPGVQARTVSYHALPRPTRDGRETPEVYVLGPAPAGGWLIYCEGEVAGETGLMVVGELEREGSHAAVLQRSLDPRGDVLEPPFARIPLTERQALNLGGGGIAVIESLVAPDG